MIASNAGLSVAMLVKKPPQKLHTASPIPIHAHFMWRRNAVGGLC